MFSLRFAILNTALLAMPAAATLRAQSAPSPLVTHGPPRDVAAIRAARAELNRALVVKDTGIIARYWIDEAVSTGYAGRTSTGREMLVQNFARTFADTMWGGGVRTPTSIEVSAEFGTAAEQGAFVWHQLRGPQGQTVRGRYLVVWVNRDGAWKVRTELYGATSCEGGGCPTTTR